MSLREKKLDLCARYLSKLRPWTGALTASSKSSSSESSNCHIAQQASVPAFQRNHSKKVGTFFSGTLGFSRAEPWKWNFLTLGSQPFFLNVPPWVARNPQCREK